MTASAAFINYYGQNNEDEINLKSFLKKHYTLASPIKKLKLNYDSKFQSLTTDIKECILSNLNLNPNFTDSDQEKRYYKELFNLFNNTTQTVNQNEIAQLLLLLHFSKSQLRMIDFILLFNTINTIRIVENFKNYSSYEAIKEFYEEIISNAHLITMIQEVITNIIGKESSYEFKKTKMSFFKHDLRMLNGFAGINTIYVNIDLLLKFMDDSCIKSKNFSSEDIIIILKMEFLRIVLHEITHVALRFSKKDLNMSTPNEKKNFQQSVSLPFDSSLSYDAGALCEKKAFNGSINWLESARNNVNINYCKEFLNQLFSGLKPVFEMDKARIILKTNPIVTMAIDMDDEYFDLQFE